MNERIGDVIDIFGPRRTRRRGRFFLLLAMGALLLGGGTAVSYYVEALWFDSLGYADVFWTTVHVQVAIFSLGAIATFVALYGSFLALKPSHFDELSAGGVVINGRPVNVPVGPVLRVAALAISLFVTLATATGLVSEWSTFALWWHTGGGPLSDTAATPDPIFGRPLSFYLFTLPAWELIVNWLTSIAVIAFILALFFRIVSAAGQALANGGRIGGARAGARGLAAVSAALMAILAAQVYLGRFERLLDDRTMFTGVSYTSAHVGLAGALLLAVALLIGALMALASGFVSSPNRWLVASIVPAFVIYLGVAVVSAYVSGFIVKPNELVRESPYIAHNIEQTRRAFGLDRMERRAFPAEPSIEAMDPAGNRDTLENIRLWDWRALQDTLRQLQEIRTYYDFPDIDIDRYIIDGAPRQVMLATRELSIDKLPQSSRNWINEKLIYTHGYGITMNPVNGFTPEGLPALLLKDMPVQSTVASLKITRPEVYFGEMTNADVYVKTRQQEFNYPQGQTNNLTSYEGTGGIVLGGVIRRLVIAFDRGDIGKLPFSDDVTNESRLLMRRNVRDRVAALAPFLVVDDDPYIVLTDSGRLSWVMDAFTVSDRYPYSRSYMLGRHQVNYVRNSVKVAIDAYDGTTTFYVFDASDPLIAAYRRVFPTLFKDAAEMPADLRRHVRYPEALLALQADVFGLYHMTTPEVFYNREDLWTVASDASTSEQSGVAAQPMDPNFVLMKLPGEPANTEFVEMLPFTPSNRNNLIGWIAGRSDGEHYGELLVYDFPKTRLVDGPLQVEARIDQNAALSGQLSLWNQQGSRVRRGSLLVIPIGRALLYAEAIYLQAERSPMPELRLVVLAMQDRLVYATTFEAALANLLAGGAGPGAAPGVAATTPSARTPGESPVAGDEVNALIAEAANNLSEYQRLTAEGKLGEAGQKLEALKRTLDALSARRH